VRRREKDIFFLLMLVVGRWRRADNCLHFRETSRASPPSSSSQPPQPSQTHLILLYSSFAHHTQSLQERFLGSQQPFLFLFYVQRRSFQHDLLLLLESFSSRPSRSYHAYDQMGKGEVSLVYVDLILSLLIPNSSQAGRPSPLLLLLLLLSLELTFLLPPLFSLPLSLISPPSPSTDSSSPSLSLRTRPPSSLSVNNSPSSPRFLLSRSSSFSPAGS